MKKFSLKSLTPQQKELRLKILQLAFDANHSHIGSCLSSLDLITAVYKTKKDNEKFVLSNGHAGMALYVVLHKYRKIKDFNLINKMHIHPDRNSEIDVHVSTGSLGHGLPIATGIALANKKERVYCLISDGECAEGSIWEALRVISEKNISNLRILLDANGWSGYDSVNLKLLIKRLEGFGFNVIKVDGHNIDEITKELKKISKKPKIIFGETSVNQFPFLKGQDAHYYVMNQNDFNLASDLLK